MESESIYFEPVEPTNYLESLMCARQHLTKKSALLAKLDNLIDLELELAIMGAEKAKSEALKEKAKDNVKPIKPI